jgi:hypothetical protein
MVDADPQNAALRINLARAHAMAFANRGASVPVVRTLKGLEERDGVWFGPPQAANVPFAPVASDRRSTPPGDVEKVHLSLAIAAYEQGLRLDPLNNLARLGYGWCVEQAGDKAAAIDAYRRVIAEVWPAEQAGRGIRPSPGPGPITAEAARYLMPLLDPVKDKEEIQRLRGYVSELDKKPRMITPVVIPLVHDRDVSQLVDRFARVRFDADGGGLAREWTWISKDAGWLVYDQRGTKQIASSLQLFGNVTFWMFWANGYEALRALDDNQDGRLAGAEFTGLGIWRDGDSDGISDAGEVRSLAGWGIVALSCAYESEDESDVYIASSRRGVTFADGSTRPTYDVLLHPR